MKKISLLFLSFLFIWITHSQFFPAQSYCWNVSGYLFQENCTWKVMMFWERILDYKWHKIHQCKFIEVDNKDVLKDRYIISYSGNISNIVSENLNYNLKNDINFTYCTASSSIIWKDNFFFRVSISSLFWLLFFARLILIRKWNN